MEQAQQEIRSVQTFLQQVWALQKQSDTVVDLFRGQPHSFPLLPKLFRPPNTVRKVMRHEQELLRSLTEVAPHLRPSKPTNDWDWLSLGQHYGMSTRMSDWSANPLIALFFAVELNPAVEMQPLVYHYPIREGYEDDRSTSPLEIDHTKVMKVEVHSHRAEAQAAWQIVHAIHDMGDGTYRFFPLNQMPPHDQRITMLPVSRTHIAAIREELAHWGISHSTVYGEFGWVCRSLAPSFGLA